MSNQEHSIPQEWHKYTLRDIGKSYIGLTYSPENVVTDGGTLVLRSSNIFGNRIVYGDNVYVDMEIPERVIVKPGDLLICVRNGSRALIGKNALIDESSAGHAFGAFMAVFRSESNSYLVHLFQTDAFQEQIQKNLGATINQITNNNLENFEFVLPSPPEQRKIAAILSTWDAAIRLTADLIAAKQQRKKGLMQRLLSGEVRFAGFEGRAWPVMQIGSIAHVTAGGTPSTNRPEYWQNGTVPWMRSGEVHQKRVQDVKDRITELGMENSNAKLVPPNSILVALAGQGKTRGTVAINEIPLTTNQSIAAIIPQSTEVDYEFLFYDLDSRYDELRRLSAGDGGRGGLNLSLIKSMEVKLPPIKEQQKIAAILKTCDQELDLLRQKLAALHQQKKGLMQQLLTGRIRVTSDELIY